MILNVTVQRVLRKHVVYDLKLFIDVEIVENA